MELVSLAKNPLPSGGIVGTFSGYDGAELRFARWDATRQPRRGTVCLFPGRAEFIEKYFEVIADLRRRGFAVATLDWRGQGGSQRMLANPRKGHVRGFWEYDRDLVRFMKDVVLPDCPPPFIGLGHSMGGNILLRNATMPGLWFERIILTAPMIAISEATLGTTTAKARIYAEIASQLGMFTAYVPGGSDELYSTQKFDGNVLTSDHERWLRTKAVLEQAPALGLGSPTVGWLRSALRSCRMLCGHDYAGRINVPLLLFASGNDKLVSTRAIEDFAVRAKLSSCILMPGAQHEILQENDTVRLRFWAAFDAYMGVEEPGA
ncbi:alpha/beta fold hydrolase [Hyphomicrobium sulfonivorans]|uniref:alpha/beta fold hydrolase n=1 Tax=Hyphomicrobium sulfonivorans TaxID=121290 RepID=UPI00156D4B11|nr:alpha/beta hydrolase [Hyphomicrobium sulfonivorans]MBI1649313.1 alpha/beta hydrolase [Hyphomicrobium sulfonivorans]NSL71233.1 alpha/beta hydrolase [Hyphomicrobium sulfonivorans]